jgi:hypothetical protein
MLTVRHLCYVLTGALLIYLYSAYGGGTTAVERESEARHVERTGTTVASAASGPLPPPLTAAELDAINARRALQPDGERGAVRRRAAAVMAEHDRKNSARSAKAADVAERRRAHGEKKAARRGGHQ